MENQLQVLIVNHVKFRFLYQLPFKNFSVACNVTLHCTCTFYIHVFWQKPQWYCLILFSFMCRFDVKSYPQWQAGYRQCICGISVIGSRCQRRFDFLSFGNYFSPPLYLFHAWKNLMAYCMRILWWRHNSKLQEKRI